MSSSFKKFQETFEIFANQQAAEIEAVRAVLQGFLTAVLRAQRQGPAAFQSLRDDVLARLETETKRSDSDQDAIRKAVFVHLRAEEIFDELAPAFGLEPTQSSQSKH